MFNNKPPAFHLSQPSQPASTDLPVQQNWNCPWSSTDTTNAVMLFNGVALNNNPNPVPPPSPIPSTSGVYNRQPRVKRKSESDDFIPPKHFISEEKMVAHLNGLHLSDNYQQHNLSDEGDLFEADMDPGEASSSFNVNLSPQELEQRLKNAQRITLCEQIRKSLKEDSEIIPKLLLNRIEKPCTALILWRPPEPIEKLITNFETKSDEEEDDEDMDNNNNNNDPNNNMDLDV